MCTAYKLLNHVIFLKHDLIVLGFYFIVALVSCTVISGVRVEAVFHFFIFLFNHKSKQTTKKKPTNLCHFRHKAVDGACQVLCIVPLRPCWRFGALFGSCRLCGAVAP